MGVVWGGRRRAQSPTRQTCYKTDAEGGAGPGPDEGGLAAANSRRQEMIFELDWTVDGIGV